ncbi:hypothetical protein SUDANB145_03333 [Streptomyces sp. enrichment culture]|uniref:hypothetical protein n=1 Tax=Streptomyces sp. enrichment culture TaxID=1795815 RepID=UPI003F56CE10
MPTPYGSRGGLAFGVEELRVLRRALALALSPSPVSTEDVQDCLRLAESLDEATRESARLRAFLLADLARYRAALPGTAAGYLALLDEALSAGHRPARDDLTALGALRGNPTAAALLRRCQALTPTVPAARTRLLALPGGGPTARPDREPDQDRDRKPGAPRPQPGPPPATPKRPVPTPGEVFPRRKPAPPPGAGAPGQHLAAG